MRLGFLAGLAGFASLGLGLGPAGAEAPVTTFELDNGMDVVVIEDHRAPVVTHMVWYKVGAADEPRGKSGIAHLFEHLMFKGTDTIPEGAFSKVVAENGGQDNAFTSWDYTAYFQRIAADRLGTVMAMEADRMQNLRLTEELVATERDVILEERRQRTDNSPQALFAEQMRATLYHNHPYGVPIVGWQSEIEALNLDDALAFYERYYAPDNATLVVAGDVTPDEVRKLAEEHYGPLEPSGRPADPRAEEPPHIAAQRLEMRDARVRQPYVNRYYLAPAYDADTPQTSAALSVLADVLGDGITSRLSQELELGDEPLAVSTGAWYSSTSRDNSIFGLYAVPRPGVSLPALETAMDATIERLAEEGPTADELERVKRKARASLVFAQDDQSTLARIYGAALTNGYTVEDVKAWPDQIDAVTAEDVQRVAREVLRKEQSVTGYLRGTDGEAG